MSRFFPRDPSFPPVLVWSHGRSGSTLLLDTIASDPGMWPIYEPLQEVRQRPPAHFFVPPEQVGPCRDRDDGTNTLQSPCPLRDASIAAEEALEASLGSFDQAELAEPAGRCLPRVRRRRPFRPEGEMGPHQLWHEVDAAPRRSIRTRRRRQRRRDG